MRILFTTTKGAGHWGPLLPFAHACQRAGHAVLATVPRSAAAAVEHAGLPVVAVDEGDPEARGAVFGAVRGLPEIEANQRVGAEVFVGIDARAALPGVREAIASWRPDVVVSELAEAAGGVAGEAAGLPTVTVSVALALPREVFGDRLAAAVDELRVEEGLPSDAGRAHLLSGRILTLSPASLDATLWGRDAEVHRFRDPGEHGEGPSPVAWPGDAPLVYVTFGSVAAGSGYYPVLYREVLDALADLDARVLMTVGRSADPAELGPLPANARVERWIPQGTLLPHCAAMVCHGGSGTVRQGLAAGVPLVVLPLFADQPDNARLVHELGAGLALTARGSARATPEDALALVPALPGALREVLEVPGYRAVAERVRAETAALPPVDAAVELLRELAAA